MTGKPTGRIVLHRSIRLTRSPGTHVTGRGRQRRVLGARRPLDSEEDGVLELAGHWSVDPYTLDSLGLPPSVGVVGRLGTYAMSLDHTWLG